MSDISNRTIVALLAVALVVSVAGTMYSVSELGQMSFSFRQIAGAAVSEQGNISLDLQATAAIEVHQEGGVIAGGVESGKTHCIVGLGGDNEKFGAAGNEVDVDEGANCTGNFGLAAERAKQYHLLENTGNIKVNISATPHSASPGVADVCQFITGYADHNLDGSDGCSNNVGVGTDSTIPVHLALGSHQQFSASNTRSETQLTGSQARADATDDTSDSFSNAQKRTVYFQNNMGFNTSTSFNHSNLIVGGADGIDFQGTSDEALVGFNMIIPSGALPGSRQLNIMYAAKAN